MGTNEKKCLVSPASWIQLQSLLLAEIETRQQELDALRSSIRYRLGDEMLQALPLSWRSLLVLPRLYGLFRTYRRNLIPRSRKAGVAKTALTVQASNASVIYYGGAPAESSSAAWWCSDAAALLARLDMAPVSQLVLRHINEPIARRLGRLKMQGCRIIWWPEEEQADSLMENYVRALADECRAGESH